MRSISSLLFAIALLATDGARAALPDPATLREWIAQMKESPRGPFSNIRWYCKDGAILEPKAGACVAHGGGIQHGEWSPRTRELRDGGYPIANVLAALDPAALLAAPEANEHLAALLVEQHLVQVDDGWILRAARFYRGALQVEDEAQGARALLDAALNRPGWREDHFLLLREAARLLPLTGDNADAARMRDLATEIALRDGGFAELRNKLHVMPEADDATRVRHYAEREDVADADPYLALADAVDALFGMEPSEAFAGLIRRAGRDAALEALLASAAPRLTPGESAPLRLAAAGRLLRDLRARIAMPGPARIARLALEASLIAERFAFAAAAERVASLPVLTRRERFETLAALADVLHGIGLLSERQHAALGEPLAALGTDWIRLMDYRAHVRRLNQAAHWPEYRLRFEFDPAVERFTTLDPRAARFFEERLRATPATAFAEFAQSLDRDALDLAGVRHEFMGEAVTGFSVLNSGLARGVLHTDAERPPPRDAIVLVPEVTAELPPVAGILTLGSGNALSHVQILARNLGIPNIAVGAEWFPALSAHEGRRIVLAASPGGAVRISPDGPDQDPLFRAAATQRLSLETWRLDLLARGPIPLDSLGSADSGVRVGPKAGELAELKRHWPNAVANGLVLPFGAFAALLERPIAPGGASLRDWMTGEYARLAALPDDGDARARELATFLARVRQLIEREGIPSELRARLTLALRAAFGEDGAYGVFVRSDTNVEDLSGFTGAGLNLTVPNVSGVEEICAAIARVWASPFTDRAFGWRERHIEPALAVYPSVLLLESVPVEKSGVLITTDVDDGDPRRLSVAVSEGIGGAVGGERAEELRIERASGAVRLVNEATASRRRILAPGGGLASEPATGRSGLLRPAEIERLRVLVDELPGRIPWIIGPDGKERVADIEFGFRDGKLVLFQIRPYGKGPAARASEYLIGLDRNDPRASDTLVDLRRAGGG